MRAVEYVYSHGKFSGNVNITGACVIRALMYTRRLGKRLITPVFQWARICAKNEPRLNH
jgi:hypothetical protein